MQCVACGGPIEPAANFCPTCGTPTTSQPPQQPQQPPGPPSDPWAPPAYGAAPYGQSPASSAYGADLGYQPSPMDATARRHRRRQGIVVGAAAVVALAVVIGVALNATSTSGSPSAASTPSAQTVSDDGSVLVTYAPAHFSERFPSTPVETQEPGSFGGVRFTVYIAAVVSPQRMLVGSQIIGARLPAGQEDVALRSAVGSFAGTSGLSLARQQSTTFQGYPARQANLTDADGNSYTFLAFVYNGTRLYMIFGPSGDPFDSLTANFTALK